MNRVFFLGLERGYLWVVLALAGAYFLYRLISGRLKFRNLLYQMEGEGLLRVSRWTPIRVKFPLIHRFTFSHIFLTENRVVLCHSVTRNKMLQVPLGPKGKPGKEDNLFFVEKAGMLTFKTPIRGGGRIRMHIKDAKGWLEDIKNH